MPGTDRVRLAVILAAGGGTRMGRPKGLLARGDRPLLIDHVQALSPFADRVIAVIGSNLAEHRAILGSTPWVHNPDWATTWPADSLRIALLAHPDPGRVLVTPVDTPPAAAATLSALVATAGSAVPLGPEGPGHPVLLDAALADRVRAEAPPGGLRALLGDAALVPVEQVDVARDFDTVQDWEKFTASG